MNWKTSAEPAPVRTREHILAAIALILFCLLMAKIQASDVSDKVIEEKADRHAAIYKALAECMNGKNVIYVADEPIVECRRVKERK